MTGPRVILCPRKVFLQNFLREERIILGNEDEVVDAVSVFLATKSTVKAIASTRRKTI